SSFRGELEIGYCRDSLIRGKAKECMLCRHGPIDLNDLKVKRDQILKKVKKKRDNLMKLMNLIYKIKTNTDLNIMTPEHLENEKDLEQTFLNIKSELQNLSKLIQIERSIY